MSAFLGHVVRGRKEERMKRSDVTPIWGTTLSAEDRKTADRTIARQGENSLTEDEALEQSLAMERALLKKPLEDGELVVLMNDKGNIIGDSLANMFLTLSGEGWEEHNYFIRDDEVESRGIRDGKEYDFKYRLLPKRSPYFKRIWEHLSSAGTIDAEDFSHCEPVGERVREALWL